MQPAAILSILVKAQGITQAQSGLRSLDASARKAEGTLGGMAKTASRAASTVAKVGAVGIGASLVYSVKKAADFEAQLSSLGSVAGATGKEMDALRKSALKAGADTKFSALEAAKAQTELAKGGLKTSQILSGGLSSALALAAAGEMELADAASTTVNSMKLFRIQGARSIQVADALATAANSTTADVSDFALALNQAGSAAKAVGLNFPETIAALETLAEVGVKGSDAGTSLKTALIQLASPSSAKASEMAKKLGLNIFDSTGKIKSLVEVSKELRDGLGDLTEKQRIQAATTLVGQDGFRALLALYDAGPEKIAKLQRELGKEGSAAEVARKKQDNLKGSLEQLGGSVETLGINVGTMMIPAVRKGADVLTDFANDLGRIASDDKLDVGQKIAKSFEVAKVDAKPWVDKLGKAVGEADVPGMFADVLASAAPVIAEQAGTLGIGAVKSFVTAFNETNAWGKLLIGGVALAKTGAGGAIIDLVKKSLGGGNPLTGGRGGLLSKANPVPVFVVNQGGVPGGGGVAGKITGGAGIASRLVPIFAGGGASAAVAGGLIGYLAVTHNENNPTRGAGASSPSNPAGHVAFDQGAPSRRVTSNTTPGMKDEGAAAAAAGAEQLRKRVQAVAADIRKLRDSSITDFSRIASSASENFREIRDHLGSNSEEGRRLAAHNFQAAASAIAKSMHSGKGSVDEAMGTIRSLLGRESGKGKDALKHNFDQVVPAVRDALGAAGRKTSEGLALIRGLMVDQLKLYGFSEKQALNIAKTGDPDANRGREGGASLVTRRQRGGSILTGAPSGDSVPAMLERGEYVLNRNAVQKVGVSSLDRLNFSTARRFQSGGMVAAANRLDRAAFPYVWGGGHQASPAPFGPMDCSGAVSYVLQQGGVKIPTMVSGALMSAGQPGPGAVTVFANPGHTFMRIGNRYFGTSGSNPGGGAGWFPDPGAQYRANFTQRHFSGAVGEAIKRVMVSGPASMTKSIVQGTLNTVRAGANAALDRIAGSSIGSGDAGDPGPGGLTSAGGKYNKSALMRLWRRVNPGVGDANLMAAIALAESGGNPGIVNSIGAGGLWQIHPPERNYLDPVTNARIAGRKLSSQGLAAWEAYTNGAYRQFLQRGGMAGARTWPYVGAYRDGGMIPRTGMALVHQGETVIPKMQKGGKAGRSRFPAQVPQRGKVPKVEDPRLQTFLNKLWGVVQNFDETGMLRVGLNRPIKGGGPSKGLPAGYEAPAVPDLPTAFDYLDAALAEAEATKGTTADDLAALGNIKAYRENALAAARASGDPRAIAAAVRDLSSVQDSIDSLTDAVNAANEIQRERDALNQQIADNQLRILALANQGPQIVNAVVAAVSGGIGGQLGLGFQTPGYAGGVANYAGGGTGRL